MKCDHCQAELSPGASFCGECGAPAASAGGAPLPAAPAGQEACSHCGAPLTPGGRFCGECGHPAPAAPDGYVAHQTQRVQPAPAVPPGYAAQEVRRGSRGAIWPIVLVAAIIALLAAALLIVALGGGRLRQGLGNLARRTGSSATAQLAVTVVTPPPSASPVVIVVTSQPAMPAATEPSVFADTPLPATTPLPTPTPQPTDAPLPTPTPMPTYTPLPTHTPLPTYTLPPTDTPAPPTPLPAPTQRPEATATEPPLPELSVDYRDFHYECRRNEVWTRGRPPYGDAYGDRSFQALMIITNQTADKTLEPLWRPDRWIVTNGSTEWEETYAWQYGKREGGVVKAYPQPPIVPGDTQSWTWLCYPMPRGAWVKAAEFTAWGQTYRFEFPKPAPGEFNYVDCP